MWNILTEFLLNYILNFSFNNNQKRGTLLKNCTEGKQGGDYVRAKGYGKLGAGRDRTLPTLPECKASESFYKGPWMSSASHRRCSPRERRGSVGWPMTAEVYGSLGKRKPYIQGVCVGVCTNNYSGRSRQITHTHTYVQEPSSLYIAINIYII